MILASFACIDSQANRYDSGFQWLAVATDIRPKLAEKLAKEFSISTGIYLLQRNVEKRGFEHVQHSDMARGGLK